MRANDDVFLTRHRSTLIMREVIINREPVELYKILKFEGLVGSGGEAKAVIEQGLVSVNGELETRKRRQIVAGDVIGFAEHELQVVLRVVKAVPDTSVSSAAKKRPQLRGAARRT